MKFFSTLFLLLLTWGMCTQNAQAQRWFDLYPVLSQADTSVRDSFAADLELLTEDFTIEDIDFQALIEELLSHGLDHDELQTPLSLFPGAWAEGLDSLNVLLDSLELMEIDSAELADQYQLVNEVWENNADSFNVTLDTLDDPLGFNPGLIAQGESRYDLMQGLIQQALYTLQKEAGQALANAPAQGSENFGEMLNTLFGTLFDLELAVGKEGGTVSFYEDTYEPQANVFRVGSIPAFDRTWEASWHVRAAFVPNQKNPTVEVALASEGNNPLRYGGNFSFMFNPGLGRLRGGGQLRLYSSLGIQVDTYAPAHVMENNPVTTDNVGNTTAYGPEIGTGFIIDAGLGTLYTYGSLSYGRVANSPGYQYRNRALHAGLRIGKAVNIRYERGKAQWAPDDNKAFTYNRFTVGLLLSDLFR